MFNRITVHQAKRRYKNGEDVVLCPHKLRPGYPFAPHVTVTNNCGEWGKVIAEWKYYNASREVGYYPHYYVETRQ